MVLRYYNSILHLPVQWVHPGVAILLLEVKAIVPHSVALPRARTVSLSDEEGDRLESRFIWTTTTSSMSASRCFGPASGYPDILLFLPTENGKRKTVNGKR